MKTGSKRLPSAGREPWHRRLLGEPTLPDVLAEPIIHLIMRRDGVTPEALRALIERAQATLWEPSPPPRQVA